MLDLIQIGMTTSNGVARGKFILDPARHPKEATLSIAAWVTKPGALEPLQATGGWLAHPTTETK